MLSPGGVDAEQPAAFREAYAATDAHGPDGDARGHRTGTPSTSPPTHRTTSPARTSSSTAASPPGEGDQGRRLRDGFARLAHCGHRSTLGAEATAGTRTRRASPDRVDRACSPAGAFDGADAAIVASPSSHHAEQARARDRRGPADPGGEAARHQRRRRRTRRGVRRAAGVCLRCRHEPALATGDRRLKRLVESGELGAVIRGAFWFGYDLRRWRPGVDYRESYSARADLGGGIVLDAIHELDYMSWLLGPPRAVTAVTARVSELKSTSRTPRWRRSSWTPVLWPRSTSTSSLRPIGAAASSRGPRRSPPGAGTPGGSRLVRRRNGMIEPGRGGGNLPGRVVEFLDAVRAGHCSRGSGLLRARQRCARRCDEALGVDRPQGRVAGRTRCDISGGASAQAGSALESRSLLRHPADGIDLGIPAIRQQVLDPAQGRSCDGVGANPSLHYAIRAPVRISQAIVVSVR